MSPPATIDPRERGAALLSVLLLVSVMAVLAAVMLDRLRLATALAGNGQSLEQARLYAASTEVYAAHRLGALVSASPGRTVDPGGLLGQDLPLPLPRGNVVLRIEDADNCFNVNSLVRLDASGLVAEPRTAAQFVALAGSLGIPAGEAGPLAAGIADWIDTDQVTAPGGAEDDWYRARPVPYRTSGEMIGELSELRAVRGMSEQTWRKLRPWLCALPEAAPSQVNINTLKPGQGRLLAMLSPGLDPARAEAAIRARPVTGYGRAADALGNGDASQVSVASRWFMIAQTVRVGAITLHERALILASLTPPRVAYRSWAADDE